MSAQVQEPSVPTTLPLSIIVAVAVHSVFGLTKLAMPRDWFVSGKFALLASGVSVCGATLILMGLAELKQRVPDRQRSLNVALVAYGTLLVLALAWGVVDHLMGGYRSTNTLWQVESYVFFAAYVAAASGVIAAAGGFRQIPGPAIALIVLIVLVAPPEPIGAWVSKAFGSSYTYLYLLVRIGYLAMFAYVAREVARHSTRALAAEPTRPFEQMGQAIRVRVIAMFVLIGFTLFAAGGKSLGAIKLATIAPPIINALAFVAFAIAALRAGRALERMVHVALVASAGAAAWCSGAVAMQSMAIYAMMSDSGGYRAERSTSMAQALGIVLPLVATAAIVIAMLAVGAHLRRIGHASVAASIVMRVTTFVILSLVATVIQQYLVPKAKTMSEFLLLGLGAATAGVIALLSAATVFKRASEATSTTALPTATVL